MAQSAALALLNNTKFSAKKIAVESMKIAYKFCVYTNNIVNFEDYNKRLLYMKKIPLNEKLFLL